MPGQSTLDAVYAYVVPWSEFPIVSSYPHICSAMVRIPHYPLLPSLPAPGPPLPHPPPRRAAARSASTDKRRQDTDKSRQDTSRRRDAAGPHPREVPCAAPFTVLYVPYSLVLILFLKRIETTRNNPQPSTLNPQPSTLNPQPSTLNPQPSTLNPKP